MAKVRIEYGRLNRPDSAAPGTMAEIPTTAVAITSSAVATAPGSRPTIPAGVHYAFITAIDGNVIVLAGTDPTAVQGSGKLLIQGVETLVKVTPGHLLSFIDLA